MAFSGWTKALALGVVTASLVGCSANQSRSLGMRSSTVKSSPQRMSNVELCETYLYGRKAKHSRFAISSEYRRRGLSKSYCSKANDEYYLATMVKKLVKAEEKKSKK